VDRTANAAFVERCQSYQYLTVVPMVVDIGCHEL